MDKKNKNSEEDTPKDSPKTDSKKDTKRKSDSKPSSTTSSTNSTPSSSRKVDSGEENKGKKDVKDKGKAEPLSNEPLLGSKSKSPKQERYDKGKDDKKDDKEEEDTPKDDKSSKKKKGKKNKKEKEKDVKIYVSDQSKNKSTDKHENRIKTTKYNLITFLPKNLFEQFKRVANTYFLVIAVLAAFPFSPVSPITTIIPLTFVMSVTALKEGLEDYKRYLADKEVNRRNKAKVFKNGKFNETSWENVSVGDIIKLEEEEDVPADIMIINSSGEAGKAYIETSNLDGETNLKTQQALKEMLDIKDEDALSKWKEKEVFIECEAPNNKLHKFEGRLSVDNEQYPLALKQMLLRGTTLADTDWVYGVVVFTGHNTKIMKNATKVPHKMSMLERLMNKALIIQFIIGFIIICVSVVYQTVWTATHGHKHWYLALPTKISSVFINALGTFIVLYSMIVPISLYVSMELVRVILSFFVNNDKDMINEKGKKI